MEKLDSAILRLEGPRGALVTIEGTEATRWVPEGDGREQPIEIPVRVSDGFAYRGNVSPLWIAFGYYQEGEGEIELQVDSIGRGNECVYRTVGRFFLTGESRWALGSVRVIDAYLANRQEGETDFRLVFHGRGPFTLKLLWMARNRPRVGSATTGIPALPAGNLVGFSEERGLGLPAGGFPLRVLGRDGKDICDILIPADGKFDLPSLPKGDYVAQPRWGGKPREGKKVRIGDSESPREVRLRLPVEGAAFGTVVRSSADGSLQPCGFYAPPEYDRREFYPLILALHGSSGNETEFLDALRLPLPPDLAGIFIVAPYGHGNSAFEGIGETDLWDALNAVRSEFSIDPDRIYLIGHSIGGKGAFRLAALYPDVFAAAAFIEPTVDAAMSDPTPSFVAPLLTASFPFECIANLREMPTCWVHAAGEQTISATQSCRGVQALHDLGAKVERRELPLESPATWSDVLSDREVVRWLLSQERSAEGTHVTYKTPSVLYSKRGWVEIERFSGETTVAEIEAELETEDQIGVYTTGIGAYLLDTSSLPLDRAQGIKVFTNNRASFEGNPPRDGSIRIELVEPIIGPLKSPARCGPWRQVFAGSFVYVVSSEEREMLEGWMRRLPVEESFLLPPGPIRPANVVSEAEKREQNLVCFGTIRSNPLLAELLHLTPVRVEGNRIQIGTMVFEGPELSLHMVYPSPYSKEHLVQFNVAVSPEVVEDLFVPRHRIPDFMVLDTEGRNDPTGRKALAAGWFTPEWSFDMGSIYFRDRDAAGR